MGKKKVSAQRPTGGKNIVTDMLGFNGKFVLLMHHLFEALPEQVISSCRCLRPGVFMLLRRKPLHWEQAAVMQFLLDVLIAIRGKRTRKKNNITC